MKKYRPVLLIFILLLGLSIRIIVAGLGNLTLDEAYSFFSVKNKSVGEVMSLVREDTHPPLFYLLFRFFIDRGDTEFMLRFPSLITAVLSIFFIFLLGEKVYDTKTGFLSAFLASLCFSFWKVDILARMYSMALLLSLISLYFFISILEKDKPPLWYYIFFSIASILMLYTYYFCALFIIIFIVATFFGVRKNKGLWICHGIIIISFLFWTPYLLFQFGIVKNIPSPQGNATFITAMNSIFLSPSLIFGVDAGLHLGGYYEDSFPVKRDWIVCFGLSLAVYVLLLFYSGREKLSQKVILYIIPASLFFFGLFSLFKPGFYQNRHFFIFYPYIILALSSVMVRFHRVLLTLLLTVILYINFMLFLEYSFSNNYFWSGNFEPAVEFIKAKEKKGDVIFIYHPYTKFTFDYYYQENPAGKLSPYPLHLSYTGSEEFKKYLKDHKRVFLVLCEEPGADVREWFFQNFQFIDSLRIKSFYFDGNVDVILFRIEG